MLFRSGFGKRRKTLLNSLDGVCGIGRKEIKDILGEAGIDASRRAETLGIDEFAAIANAVAERTVRQETTE